MPPAPAWTSMKTCWPRSAPILLANTRANRSAAPPAAKVTTSLTGRVGNGSAATAAVHNSARPNAAITARRLMVLSQAFPRVFRPTDAAMEHGAALRALVRHPSTRQYDCTAKAPARGKRPAGLPGGMWGVCMKTILVPTEHNSAMAWALDTAPLLGRAFGSPTAG